MAGMTTSYRRARGTAVETKQMNLSVPEDAKNFLYAVAKRAELSASEFQELLIRRLMTEMGEDGLPTWFDRSGLTEEAFRMAS